MGTLAPTFVVTLAVLAVFVLLGRRRHRDRQGSFIARNGVPLAVFIILGTALWLIFMVIMPMSYMLNLSFHMKLPPSQLGGPNDTYTLLNYRQLLFGSPSSTARFNTLHLWSLVMTIAVSAVLAFVNFVLCYPLAYYLAQRATRAASAVLLLLLIIPYWVNDILRAFAFRVLLSEQGFLNALLAALKLVDQPVDFLGNNTALFVALSYSQILIMMFALYNSLESLEPTLVEAARDLGAPWWHIHAFVVLPHAKPGIATGMTMNFMLIAGSVAIPQVLGGTRTLWFTPIVYDRFFQLFDWPQGTAYAFVLFLACIAVVMFALRVFKIKLGEIGR